MIPKQNTAHIKNYFIISIFSFLCYMPFLFNFYFGNHDWGWIKEYTPLDSGIFEGRFSQFILQISLFSGKILPIFTLIISLALYNISSILLLNLFNVSEKNIVKILLALNLIVTPYTISWLYFAFLTLSCLSWPLFVIASFSIFNTSLSLKIKLLISIILQTLALGGYPPVIDMLGVIISCLVLNDLCLNKISPNAIIKKYSIPAISIIFSIATILIIQHFLKKYNLQFDTYNTEKMELSTIVSKIPDTLIYSLHQFTNTTNFINSTYKNITLFITVLAFFTLIYNIPRKVTNYLFFTLTILILLISSVATTLVSANLVYVLYEPRIEFFSLPYIHIFSCIVLLKNSNKLTKNTTLTVLVLLFLYSINSISYASKVWKLGFDAENRFSERFIQRLESNAKFKPQNKQYTFIQGGTFNIRKRYYVNDNIKKEDSYTLSAPYIPWHLPEKAYTFYYPYSFVKNGFDIFWRFVNPFEVPYTQKMLYYLKNNNFYWPAEKSIFINDKIIILNLTAHGNYVAKEWLNKNFSTTK